jgi:hypothetical protein
LFPAYIVISGGRFEIGPMEYLGLGRNNETAGSRPSLTVLRDYSPGFSETGDAYCWYVKYGKLGVSDNLHKKEVKNSMRKVTTILLVLGLVFSLLAGSAWANEPEDDGIQIEITEVPEEEEQVADPEEVTVVTPESPFYFLKRFMEAVRLVLTFDQEKRVAYLEELVEERQKELDALERLYNDGELSEDRRAMLENALDEVLLFAERLVEAVNRLEGSEPEEPEVVEEDGETGEEEPAQPETDKYLWRIAHLQSIAERAPEGAQKGLARAIANAERQRERAIAKGKLAGEEAELSDGTGEEINEEADEDELSAAKVKPDGENKGKSKGKNARKR